MPVTPGVGGLCRCVGASGSRVRGLRSRSAGLRLLIPLKSSTQATKIFAPKYLPSWHYTLV